MRRRLLEEVREENSGIEEERKMLEEEYKYAGKGKITFLTEKNTKIINILNE